MRSPSWRAAAWVVRPSTRTSLIRPAGRVNRLGVQLWSKQAEIVQAVVDDRQIMLQRQ